MYTKKLNNNTQRASNWVRAYNNSNYSSVEDFYTRPSGSKVYAERKCIERMTSINGYGYRVLGGNSSFFTCGYKSHDGKTLYIETACNTFEIEL